MKRAAAIVTNRGGRTCHAAIIARELGIPAVVGCGDATHQLKDGAAGHGVLRRGRHRQRLRGPARLRGRRGRERGEMPDIPVKIMMNVGNPQLAFDFAQLPNDGVGLARLEFIINNKIGVHPRACSTIRPLEPRAQAQGRGRDRAAMPIRATFFVDKMAEGVATIAAAFWPKPVIVRLSDFKSNEYRKLLGGEQLRARRGKPDARLPRRLALHRGDVPRVLRARVPGAAARARRRWASPTSS